MIESLQGRLLFGRTTVIRPLRLGPHAGCYRVDAQHVERVKAFVVVAPGHEPTAELVGELQSHAKAQIAPYKYPREIEFCASLPKTATGKLRRSELRTP